MFFSRQKLLSSLEPECLQCSSVVEDKVYVIAEEGAEGDREHGGDKE